MSTTRMRPTEIRLFVTWIERRVNAHGRCSMSCDRQASHQPIGAAFAANLLNSRNQTRRSAQAFSIVRSTETTMLVRMTEFAMPVLASRPVLRAPAQAGSDGHARHLSSRSHRWSSHRAAPPPPRVETVPPPPSADAQVCIGGQATGCGMARAGHGRRASMCNGRRRRRCGNRVTGRSSRPAATSGWTDTGRADERRLTDASHPSCLPRRAALLIAPVCVERRDAAARTTQIIVQPPAQPPTADSGDGTRCRRRRRKRNWCRRRPQGMGPVVWQPGHWRFSGNTWAWQPGQYVPPPPGQTTWVPGRWAQQPTGGWAWLEGHWA